MLVALGGQEQWQRDGAVEQVDAERLAGRLGIAVAVEQVVGELERDAELLAEALERLDARPVEAAEQAAQGAGGAEQPAGLEEAALDVGLDRDLGTARLLALQGLAARQVERGEREQRDGVGRPARVSPAKASAKRWSPVARASASPWRAQTVA